MLGPTPPGSIKCLVEGFKELSEEQSLSAMRYIQFTCEKLGLKEVLGDAEMKRQRFFADPVGAGVLRRGTFLGWYAALLEGSDAVAPPPPPRAKAGDAPPPPPPPTFA